MLGLTERDRARDGSGNALRVFVCMYVCVYIYCSSPKDFNNESIYIFNIHIHNRPVYRYIYV